MVGQPIRCVQDALEDAEDNTGYLTDRSEEIASTRNCSRMCARLAPTAMRMPISFVRSVTDTSRDIHGSRCRPPEMEAMLRSIIIMVRLAPATVLATSSSCGW